MIKFYKRALTHERQVIRITSNNLITKKNTNMGQNASQLIREEAQLGLIGRLDNILDINTQLYKGVKRYAPVSEDHLYKVTIIKELLKLRGKEL